LKRTGGRAHLLVDLGFGDAGKGLLTDFFVRRTGASWVVRYNGGCQAGHNVVTPDGRHHTFSQMGSGSFVEGVRTLLAPPFLLHPTALLREEEVLRSCGVSDALDRLSISEGARLITPFHQAVGRLRELARGPARHGTCGAGIGETVRDALESPGEALSAADLRDRFTLRKKLLGARERERVQALSLEEAGLSSPDARLELALFEDDDALEDWLERVWTLAQRGHLVPDDALAGCFTGGGPVVFEGAQGVLIDEAWGFHPHTTWSSCTLSNALDLLAACAPGAEVERIGVLRTHVVRHGAGPFPTETRALEGVIREHNTTGPWQGPVRYGWFDAVLTRYALDVAGPLDTLALTHLDALPRLPCWSLCGSYTRDPEAEADGFVGASGLSGDILRLAHSETPALERQERLGRMLSRARPLYEECTNEESAYLDAVERLLARPVHLVSRGPRAADVARRPH